MQKACTYCNTLRRAIPANNFCSQTGDQISSVGNNAFYIQANDLQSGEHQSRLSIRAVFNGYHFHQVSKVDHVVHTQNYLVVNEGQSYYSAIQAERALEALIIAFRPGFIGQLFSNRKTKEGYLLDDPFRENVDSMGFYENTYPRNPGMRILLQEARQAIVEEVQDNLYLEELFTRMGEALLDQHGLLNHDLEKFEARKASTRQELFRRISTTKDYLDSHLSERLSLQDLSKIATLSPYHLLRTFKAFYGLAPHQYLTQQRLKYAHYLLEESTESITQIVTECGFESHSSFGRLFKRQFGHPPKAIRQQRNY